MQASRADLPLVLPIWGKSRVVPVTRTSVAISEDVFPFADATDTR